MIRATSALDKWPGSGRLTEDERLCCWLSSSVASLDRDFMSVVINRLIDCGTDLLVIKEVILQNYLFCGFPNMIESLIVLDRVTRERNLSGKNFVETRTAQEISEAGLELCRTVYGRNFEKLAGNMRKLSNDLFEWMIREGYGKVISRPVLDAPQRELCIVAALATLGHPRQLTSHVKGCLNLGLKPDVIRETISILESVISPERFETASTTCNAILDKNGRQSGE